MNKWIWKILLLPSFLFLIFGFIGLIYPFPYMSFYLTNSTETTLEQLNQINPDISLVLEVIFRANGLSMTMAGIFAIFIICIPFRKNEKWSVYALAIVGSIGLIGEIILEIIIL